MLTLTKEIDLNGWFFPYFFIFKTWQKKIIFKKYLQGQHKNVLLEQ